jgi:hypothetical protein
MAATNDITGDSIASRVLSAQGRENFDAAFKKKSLYKWYLDEGIIIDAEGEEYHTSVSYSEFRTHFRNNR